MHEARNTIEIINNLIKNFKLKFIFLPCISIFPQ